MIFEFLKFESEHISFVDSHPNRYWNKNKRKFLSLWALTKSLSEANFNAQLWLVNYDEEREKIKLMKVRDIQTETDHKWLCNGKETNHPNHIISNDTVMSFNEFKEKFQKFNLEKEGDSWEILEYLNDRLRAK